MDRAEEKAAQVLLEDAMAEVYFLCYRSRSTAEPNSPALFRDIAAILETAIKANKQADVTGALLYADHQFCQVLEGDKHVVMALYNKISADDRHCDISILSAGYRRERSFEQWAMAYTGNVEPIPEDLRGVLKTPDNLPTTETGEIIRNFLLSRIKP